MTGGEYEGCAGMTGELPRFIMQVAGWGLRWSEYSIEEIHDYLPSS